MSVDCASKGGKIEKRDRESGLISHVTEDEL